MSPSINMVIGQCARVRGRDNAPVRACVLQRQDQRDYLPDPEPQKFTVH